MARGLGLLAALLLQTSSAAFAGELHARVYDATVESVALVDRFELEDPYPRLFYSEARLPPIRIRVDARACRIAVRVKSDYQPLRKGPIDLYAAPEACELIAAGARTRVQYFGLADMFRLVAIEIGKKWRALPWMRLTTSARVADCLANEETLCREVLFAEPL